VIVVVIGSVITAMVYDGLSLMGVQAERAQA
jgi:hypothetical protein